MNGGERKIMKRHNVQAAEMPMTGTKKHICKGILAMLVLIFLGCATAPPQPLIIKHQNAPSQGSTAVSRTQNQKDTADGSSVSLVDSLKKKLVGLFKKKNVVSADESARFVKQSETPAALEKVTSTVSKTNSIEQNENIPAAAAVETKKDIPEFVKSQVSEEKPKETAKSDKMSADKTALGAAAEMKKESVPFGIIVVGNSDTKRYHLPGMPNYDKVLKYHRVLFESEQQAIESGYYKAGTKKGMGVPKQSKKEQIKKPDTAMEMKKEISEPVKNDEQKDVSPKAEKNDNEQKEKIPASVSEEIKKDLPEPVKNEDQKDVPPEATKSDNEQKEKITASVSEEIKKDLPEPVENEEQTDVSPEATKNDNEQKEKIPASVSEEIKKDLPEPVKNEEQTDVLPEATKSDKEQSENIPEGATEELKKDIQEQVKIQVQEEVSREIKKLDLAASVPEWIKRIRFEGDVRLRYEHDQFDQNNGTYARPDTWQQMNTTTSHDYFRYRARVGVEVPVNDKVEAIIRLSTGNSTNPISTNSTMGDYMDRDSVYFDLSYIRWHPWNFLTFEGGRIPNPWFYSDLVWSPNLNFEGFALKMNKPVTESWTTFLTLGAFPLQQDDFFSSSKYLTAGQLGLERKQEKGISAKIGAAYYNFSNITGEVNDPSYPNLKDWTAPLYQQKGNTLFNIAVSGVKTALASEFREFNVTANLDIGFWDPVHIVFLGDYVRNLGFDMSDVIQRTGFPNAGDIDGYQIGVSVGYPKIQEFGQWKAYLYYKYLGADAVVDAFTDSDFHLGGTDAKGWIFGAELGLSRNIWLLTRWLTTNEIHGNQGNAFGLPLAIDVLQVDLNVRF